MRISKILALGLVAACITGASANAGERNRNPRNGDELIGYVDAGNGAGIMPGAASMVANMFGVRLPGLGNQSETRYQTRQQAYGGYERDPGAPAFDLYADCRYSNGQIDRRCAKVVNAKLSRAAQMQGETFICQDRYGNLIRTQKFSYGCRLESKMTNY